MKCKLVRKNLSAYLDNEITDNSEPDIAEHLSGCKRCQALREELVLPRYYLRKLKEDPMKAFNINMAEMTESPVEIISPEVIKRFAVACAVIAVVLAGAYVWKSLKFAAVNVSSLEEGRQVELNTLRPTLINLGEKSWISIDGAARLQRDRNSLEMDLIKGKVYFVINESFRPSITLRASAFEIANLHTEFFAQVDNDNVGIEVLKGSLLVKFKDKYRISATQLSAGEGASGGVEDNKPFLNTYRLSLPKTTELEKKINMIKKIARFDRKNILHRNAESGQVRIEFWKGE